MEVAIIIKNQNTDDYKENFVELKRGLEKELGKNNVDVKISPPAPGEMGIGLESVTALLNKETIAKVKSFVSKFTKLKKVELTLVNSKGEKLQLNASMDKEVMYMLLNGFFERAVIDPRAFIEQPKNIERPRPDNPKKNPKKNGKKKSKKNDKKSNKKSPAKPGRKKK